tara:strand:+ start:774 stop:1334 length:561 start_codon:yes stop_codon:yes gene_type:complete
MIEEKNSIVYDLILLEADRILSRKREDRNLYYRDDDGGFIEIAQGYSDETDAIILQLLKKKKARYMITFIESIEMLNDVKPSSNRILRFFTQQMTYGNMLKNYSLRDIQQCTDMNMRYVMGAIKELCSIDAIRYEQEKNRRTYMVNPIYFYKGTVKKMFYSIKEYNKMPKRGEDLKTIKINKYELD